jgi:hypothetical protein
MKIRNKVTAFLIAIMCLEAVATADEVFRVDANTLKKQGETEEVVDFDHLLPVNRPVPEFWYLAQYLAEPDDQKQRYVIVVRDEPSGEFYIEQGDPPKPKRSVYQPYKFKKRRKISPEAANLIYEFWVNALVDVHYDRKARSVVVTRATTYTFSTFVWNFGWMHGQTSTSARDNLPPDWICDAGEALFEFVTNSGADEKQLQTRIQTNRDKFYDYMKHLDRPQAGPSLTVSPSPAP